MMAAIGRFIKSISRIGRIKAIFPGSFLSCLSRSSCPSMLKNVGAAARTVYHGRASGGGLFGRCSFLGVRNRPPMLIIRYNGTGRRSTVNTSRSRMLLFILMVILGRYAFSGTDDLAKEVQTTSTAIQNSFNKFKEDGNVDHLYEAQRQTVQLGQHWREDPKLVEPKLLESRLKLLQDRKSVV